MSDLALGDEELRELCARLLAGKGEPADEEMLADDPLVAAEVARRLDACGVDLVRGEDRAPLCVVAGDGDLSQLALACLALCALALRSGGGGKRARLTVHDLWERVGSSQGFTEAYVRRAGLGPLEARGLVKVIRPEQRASGAYVVSGPALAAVDTDGIDARLRALTKAA